MEGKRGRIVGLSRIGRRMASVLLLLAVALTFGTAHRHLNPIADLLSWGPSDSGAFVLATMPDVGGTRPAASSATSVTDSPCLACFWSDVTPEHSVTFRLVVQSTFSVESGQRPVPAPAAPHFPREASRAPPSA